MQTQGGNKDGEGSRRSPMEAKSVGKCASKECDQSETEAGAGHVVPHHSSSSCFKRCLLPRSQVGE